MVKRAKTIGTRKSELALIQTEWVKRELQSFYSQPGEEEWEFKIFSTTTIGDQILNTPLSLIGSKALFTKELDAALLEKKVDLVVHSAKDIPTQLPEGVCIAAICEREDARDAVVMRSDSQFKELKDLPPGSVVGTSSVRRTAQLSKAFPHLKFQDVVSLSNFNINSLYREEISTPD